MARKTTARPPDSLRRIHRLLRDGFVVITGGKVEYEAWAYRGRLDFDTASPIRFGTGDDPVGALRALDHELGRPPRRKARDQHA